MVNNPRYNPYKNNCNSPIGVIYSSLYCGYLFKQHTKYKQTQVQPASSTFIFYTI